jgi:hypothetical protein
MEAHRVLRRRGSHIFETIGSQMAAKLSALRAGQLRLSRAQDYSAAGRIRSIEKSNDFIGNRTRDLPAYSIVPESTTGGLAKHTGLKI